MQRLSVGSPGGKPRLDGGAAAEDEKAGKAARAAPDKSIHLVPVLTLLCFLVLFLLSHDPASSLATDSPVLATAARSLEATAETATASIGHNGGVHRRLKQEPRLARGRRLGLGLALQRQRR
ncbi:hypothetical protein E2562_035398 [Oryza meyeriana var. granulata]|uniref:Uncharacterized protein n=1 Tax=Oryza meyeriana var. granulata TaxID=110450 RepID=A0A6G1F1L9_9ORYZ|nr:hypothetical protein E2562_035398 [Oryza meyeriana var. granulata]